LGLKIISAKLETAISTLEQQADEIMAFVIGNGHRAFSQKFCYRGTIGSFNLKFSNLIRKVVDHIIDFEISDLTWLQMRLNGEYTRGHCLGLLCF
jgi:hypothetical protein